MSSRGKKLRDQNVIVSCVKDLTRHMENFEQAVEELKILKDSILEMNEEIVKQENENAFQLQKLKNDLKENRTKILLEGANEVNKILISKEELQELKDQVTKLKSDLNATKTSFDLAVKNKVQEEVETRLKLQKLEFDCETAELTASNNNYQSQIENLNQYIARMTAELESQKKLTANIAGVSSRSGDNNTSKSSDK